MKQQYHTIILGLGGLGSAALYWTARRLGADVLGLEQFEIDHSRGGSQDHSRIIRLSYHTPVNNSSFAPAALTCGRARRPTRWRTTPTAWTPAA